MTLEQVNDLGRGRVWTGRDALKIGLVDELGGLNDAIAYAVKDAKIKKPIYVYYPKRDQDKFMQLLEALAEQDDENEATESETITGEAMRVVKALKQIDGIKGIQMRMPYFMDIN